MEMFDQIIKEVIAIGEIHAAAHASVCHETTAREQHVLQAVAVLIADGNIGLYPFKALLMASNDWHTWHIVREGLFRDILLEGIEHGSLAPDDEDGWEWLKFASLSNDPTNFMTDMERYFDLLMNATEHGNDDAHDILDQIWEPENCREED